MTTSKITPSVRIGLSHIECEPVWEGEDIVLFDMYICGNWIGSKRLFKYVEEVNNEIRSKLFVQ